MIELALNGIVKYFGATLVLRNITFEVHGGEKVGLVGRNGSGKSTIMKIIAGIEKQDEGSIMLKKGYKVGYLAQIPKYHDDFTVNQVLNSAFINIDSIEEQMKRLEGKMNLFQGEELERALRQYSELQHQYELSGGYEKEEKLSKVCTGLSFSESFLQQNFNTLSGGEQTSVVLGKILLEAPNLLLLDEPTNHLDVNAIEWLEDYLKEYKGMVIIVSHDRYFLDRVATKIVEVEDMESETYDGNYSAYINTKETNMMLQFEAFQDQQKKIKAMEKAIKDLRDWAIRADNNKFFRRAASMQKRLDKMTKIERPVFEKPNMKLGIQNSERSGRDVIKIDKLTKGFENKVLLKDADLLVRYGEKVALIGANGSGKSTLIKLLLEEESVDQGSAELGASVRVGYLPQHIVFPDEDMTVVECFRDGITISEGKAREYLSKFLFYGENVYKRVKSLSGGEKSRLKLSKLLYEDTNLLILDEPTNHLDIDSIETLEETFEAFDGTIFFVSHDRYFINKLCSSVVALEDKKLVSYAGNYEYYREKRSEAKQELKEIKLEKKEKPQKVKIVDEDKKKERQREKLEESIGNIEEQLRLIEEKMNSLASNYEELENCHKEQLKLQKSLEELMEQWILVG
jgi:ATPase subunit of ABC transporter with duplicated ATPase domains